MPLPLTRILIWPSLLLMIAGSGACKPEASTTSHPSVAAIQIERTTEIIAPAIRMPGTAEPLVLFSTKKNRLRGWSHLADGAPGLPRPRFPLEEYAIREDVGTAVTGGNVRRLDVSGAFDSVGEVPRAFHAILVKRLADWDRNHLNGIEPLFADAPLRLGDVESIVLEIFFDSKRSSIPTPAALAEAYGKLLTAEQLAALDNGRAHLGISLFEAGYNDHDRAVFGGSVILEIDPARDFDRWLRMTIPVEALEWYFEKNYARTPTNLRDQLARQLVGLRINPETRGGLTVRHSLRDAFGPQVPETLKEMAFAIRRLEIRRRP